MPTMVREAWTDDRLDDLKEHMDEGFREVRTELRRQREEMARQKDMDARFDAVMRAMQFGFSLIGVVLAALLALVGTQL